MSPCCPNQSQTHWVKWFPPQPPDCRNNMGTKPRLQLSITSHFNRISLSLYKRSTFGARRIQIYLTRRSLTKHHVILQVFFFCILRFQVLQILVICIKASRSQWDNGSELYFKTICVLFRMHDALFPQGLILSVCMGSYKLPIEPSQGWVPQLFG